MPKLLLNLRDVPEDEADEVRTLLKNRGIVFYETKPGPWGISMGGIWLRHDTQWPTARALLDEYASDRQMRVRAQWIDDLREGRADTSWTRFRRHPVLVLVCLALAAGLAYVMVAPFFGLAG